MTMPLAYCRSLPAEAGANHYKQLYPQHVGRFALPQNVTTRTALSKEVPPQLSFSFFDVPALNISETFTGCLENCEIVCCPNEWGRESYAILSADNRVIQVQGTEFRPEHRRILRSGCEARRLPEATWVLYRFYGAYFRWLTQVLPHIVLACEQGNGDTILYPPDSEFKPYMCESLSMINVHPKNPRVSLDTPLTICGKLNIIESDSFCGPVLQKMRNRLVANSVPRRARRRIYICRKNARWRRCENEAQVWALLKHAGYERHCMEELTFPEQVSLMSEASVIIGLHGAGLANMIFCPERTHVVEIVDPGRLNPHYYALSSCLDLCYWYIEGTPMDAEADPVYRNLSVDIAKLECIVKGVESKLS